MPFALVVIAVLLLALILLLGSAHGRHLMSKLRIAAIAFPALLVYLIVARRSTAQTYAYQSYGAEVGVPVANAITVDAHGWLLVGTNDGLVRFDGFDFAPVPLPGPAEPRVLRLARGPDGSVWVLASGGRFFRLDRNGRVTAVWAPSALVRELADYRSSLRVRLDGDGRLWTNGSASGLWRYDPATVRWTHVDPAAGERIVDFFFEGRNAIWLATRDRVGRMALSDGEGRLGAWKPGWAEIVFLRPHSPGRAWVGTQAGVFLLNAAGAARRVLGGEYAAWWHAEPATDEAGQLLMTVGYARGEIRRLGIVRVSAAGDIEFPGGPEPALPEYTPRQLLFGDEGDFWLAHLGGLIHVEQEYLVSYPLRAPDGTPEIAKQLVEGPLGQGLWVSTWGGMYRLRHGRAERLSTLPRRATTHAVLARDGGVWWMEHDGLGFAVREGQLRSGTERAQHLVFETRAGTAYVARGDGFYRGWGSGAVRLSRRRFIAAPAAESGDGRLWLSPGFQGLDTVEGDSLGTECRGCLRASVRAILDAMRAVEVDEMHADAYGRLWIAGGRGGLLCVFQGAGGAWRMRRLSAADGLLSDEVHAVAPTTDGRLWIGTPRGLQAFRLRAGEPVLDPLLEFRARDGMPSEYVSTLLEDRNGFVWFGTTPGQLHRLDYRRIPKLASPPVRIARLERDGVPQRLGSQPLRVRSRGGRIAIQLAPQTYREVRQLRFEYRLSPADTSWVSLGTGRSVQIPFLPAGRYLFEARTVRPGQLPGPALRFGLVAVPPFYRTWWFILVLAGAVSLPAVLWYRARAEKRLALERLRLRIATDLHDDIGSGLTQVSLYSELIRRSSAPPVATWAESVGEQARAISEGIRDIVWAIQLQHESWEALELRMKDYAAELLAPRGIAFDMQGTAAGRPPALSTDTRRNLLLMFKEAVHNAARHASCQRVEVRWHLSPHRLWLAIRDDGQGFDPGAARPGNGLANLRRRAAEIGAALRLDAAPGRGAAIELELPLQRRTARDHQIM